MSQDDDWDLPVFVVIVGVAGVVVGVVLATVTRWLF